MMATSSRQRIGRCGGRGGEPLLVSIRCQWPSSSPHWWPRVPRWWPSFSPRGGPRISPPTDRRVGGVLREGGGTPSGGGLGESVAVLPVGDVSSREGFAHVSVRAYLCNLKYADIRKDPNASELRLHARLGIIFSPPSVAPAARVAMRSVVGRRAAAQVWFADGRSVVYGLHGRRWFGGRGAESSCGRGNRGRLGDTSGGITLECGARATTAQYQ